MTRLPKLFSFALLGAAAMLSLGMSSVQAGVCPPGKAVIAPRPIPNLPEKFLKRETLSEVPLKGWRGLGDLILRMRRLTIGPGGFVPTHYHDDRPSIVFIVSGEIYENNTFCLEPILHKAGEYTPEFGPFHGHFWENKGTVPAVVISADVIPPEYRDTPDDM